MLLLLEKSASVLDVVEQETNKNASNKLKNKFHSCIQRGV